MGDTTTRRGRPKGSKNKPKTSASITSSTANTKKISTPSGAKSTKEIKNQIMQSEKSSNSSSAGSIGLNFAQVAEVLKLVDLTKSENRTYRTYSKDLLRQYLRNPSNYRSELRNLSKFLYRYCYPYRRQCWYNAHMIDLNAVSIIPKLNFGENEDLEGMLTKYYETATELQRINLMNEIFKLAVVAWREDSVYGYVYDDGTEGGFFIHILDGDYCRVSSIEDGVLRFAFDFSYFRSHSEYLEFWDSEWQTKYDAYINDTNLRWQEIDVERQICFKIDLDDVTLDYPPFASLFESIIDLIDLQSVQSVKDELSIYKLLVARLKPLTGTKEPDDFEVDIKSAIAYFNNLRESLPPEVEAVLSPLPIEPIEFNGDTTKDVDSISNAISNLFKKAGGSQILGTDKSGSTIFKAQILCDTKMALSSILPQIERWMNKYLDYTIGDDHARIKYMEVSPYTKADKKEELLKSGQNGVPVKLAVAALDGFTPMETLSLDILENQMLELHTRWIPFSTSYTQSGNEGSTDEGGAPEKKDLTDEGEATREQDKNNM